MKAATPALAAAIVWTCVLGPGAAARAAEKVEVGKHLVLIQGFEDADVLDNKPNVSYLSGVPEAAEVEVWDTAEDPPRRLRHPLPRERRAQETGQVLPGGGVYARGPGAAGEPAQQHQPAGRTRPAGVQQPRLLRLPAR